MTYFLPFYLNSLISKNEIDHGLRLIWVYVIFISERQNVSETSNLNFPSQRWNCIPYLEQ